MKRRIVCLTVVILLLIGAGTALATDEDYGLVLKGPHSGSVTQGNKVYPFEIQVDYFFPDNGEITGVIRWPSLKSVHEIAGTLKGDVLFFKETGYIQKGAAKLGCEYRMRYAPGTHVFQGTWTEPGTPKGGTAVIRLNP